eukprot:TRINITY_DN16007_c0_g1_i2.p1 TRINITY_DN16007_c0_g1~~TRINITY_DN16007_c0_g1_i2.p1  ORF type:complete len:204 (-),score=28.05 TRINITY_DN16007_c0_g1_i2:59-670(-)
MYVQYGGAGFQPGMYQQAPAVASPHSYGAVGSGYIPQQIPQQMPSMPPQQAMYGAGGSVKLFQSPRDLYAQAPGSAQYGLPPGVTNPGMAADNGYGASMQQPAATGTFPPAYGTAGVMPGAAPQQQLQAQLAAPSGAVAAPAPQHPFPAALTQPTAGQEGEPDDDDPNRLPTFVKVRGLPAEHDPRIARRPKPKKRAPGVCCA